MKSEGKDVEEALSIVAEICDLADELPEAGLEFGESVAEKARDIGANIESHNRVTEKQMAALENMKDGLERWFER